MALVFVLAGCIDSKTTVQVRPDGSGILVQEIAVTDQFVSLLEMFSEGQFDPETDLFNRDDIEASASVIGSDVTFLDFRRADRPGFRGFVARFAFKDVSTIDGNFMTNVAIPGFETDDPKPPRSELFSFTPTRRGGMLFIDNFEEDEALYDVGELNLELDEEAAVAVPYMAGLKVVAEVEFIGTILETNAEHRNGNKITLIEIDFDKLAQNPDNLAIFLNHSEESGIIRQALAGAPGLKFDSNPRVTTLFN